MSECYFCGKKLGDFEHITRKLIAGKLVPVCIWCYQMAYQHNKEEFLKQIKRIYKRYQSGEIK